jgi:hypothetical protein
LTKLKDSSKIKLKIVLLGTLILKTNDAFGLTTDSTAKLNFCAVAMK